MRSRLSLAATAIACSVFVAVPSLPAQSAAIAPPPQQTPAPSGDGASDRFVGLRENADRMRAAYEKLDTDSMAEIDKLIRSKRCFAPRVDGLLTRVVEMLNQWNEAELKYWTVWADAEADRVASQQKSLASMEQEMKRADDLIVSTTKDREDLLRQKANLEKAGRAQTEGIRKQIDSLILDIKDSEARLADAQKNYEEVSSKVTSIKASLQARLIEMRQNKRSVEAYGLDMNSYYQSVRAAEQEICNTSQPGTLKQKQLPSSKPKAQP